MKAYYFAEKSKKLRYGDEREIVIRGTHTVDITKKNLKLCSWGLHASKKALDALSYAPGEMLYVVKLEGKLVEGDDKMVAEMRTYVVGFDSTDLLREFARKQALINIEKVYPYCNQEGKEALHNWLTTGNKSHRSAAQSAVESAAWSATGSAAESARSARSAANEMLEQMIKEHLDNSIE